MSVKRITMSVISDLASDQRVHKVASYLKEKGADLLVIGRQLPGSLPPGERAYKIHRIPCRFSKGVLQYLEFNLRLLLQLLKTRSDILIANDLDTLGPNYLVSVIGRKPLVYDSHEYFTGVPELKNRKGKRWIWKTLERILLPQVKYSYTVNDSIRDLYAREYGIQMEVVRNLPLKIHEPLRPVETANQEPGSELSLPGDRQILIMQGAGINSDRGYEEAIDAMKYLPGNFLLVIIGDGNVLHQLKERVKRSSLEQKVLFIKRVPYSFLKSYTRQAWLGLSLDKPISVNNSFSLPNKLFDYIHSGIPVLASDLVEVKKIIDRYNVGACIHAVSAEQISRAVLDIYNNQDQYLRWKENTISAAEELTWENEKKELDKIFDQLL